MDMLEDGIAVGVVEFKFASSNAQVVDGVTLPPGEFLGYGSVFGNQDSHGDVIAPGAFAETIAQRKSAGRGLPMHAMHGIFGGDGLPIGVWKSVQEDATGLRVHGKISGMDTDAGKLNWARLKDGAYGGLSIGYTATDATKGKKAGEPKRTINKIALHEISLVDDPSNALARIDEMKRARAAGEGKAVLSTPSADKAAASIAAAMTLHRDSMSGSDSPTADERAAMMTHLQDAHEHLTGSREPAESKAGFPADFEFKEEARDARGRWTAGSGYSASDKTAHDKAVDQMDTAHAKIRVGLNSAAVHVRDSSKKLDIGFLGKISKALRGDSDDAEYARNRANALRAANGDTPIPTNPVIGEAESAGHLLSSAVNHIKAFAGMSEERASHFPTLKPRSAKSIPDTIRELELYLRDVGLSHSQARSVAELGFKGLQAPRDEGSGQATHAEAARRALDFL